MPTSPGQVYQSIWSDVLGLPTGLNCPQMGGILSPLCGGVSPLMDAEAANNGNPDLPVLDARTNALAQALRKTNVQALNSPCTIGGFYVASATIGAGGAAVANSEEIAAVASENYPTWLNKFFSWLAGKASNPGPVGATAAAVRAAYKAGKQFCGSF